MVKSLTLGTDILVRAFHISKPQVLHYKKGILIVVLVVKRKQSTEMWREALHMWQVLNITVHVNLFHKHSSHWVLCKTCFTRKPSVLPAFLQGAFSLKKKKIFLASMETWVSPTIPAEWSLFSFSQKLTTRSSAPYCFFHGTALSFLIGRNSLLF